MVVPRITVVTIFLNGAAYLREAVESVLAQSFTDFELIMVDDGSTDGSTGIAREYATRDPDRCIYIEHPGHANRGMSASRNTGIAAARGQVVAFIDADDVWVPEKLSEQLAILDANPDVGLVAGAANYWRSWAGGRDEIVSAGHKFDRAVPPGAASTRVYPLGPAQAPCPSVLMVRRAVLESIGGFESSFTGPLQMYEDQAFLSKAYLATGVWFSSRCWLLYRQHAASCVAQNLLSGNYHQVRRHFLEWYETYLESNSIDDPAIRDALRSALAPYRHPILFAARARVEAGAATIRRAVRRVGGAIG